MTSDTADILRTSTLFSSLSTIAPGACAADRVAIGSIVSLLGQRTFALLIVVLGLPNCLPMPPPIPSLSGILLLVVAIQIIIGMRTPWLPERLLARTISRADLDKAVHRAMPWLTRLERVARPRLNVFGMLFAQQLVGVVVFVFALGLIFAAPFVGQVPVGLAVCLVGLGLVERDGVIVLAGFLIGSVGVTLTLGFVFALASAASII